MRTGIEMRSTDYFVTIEETLGNHLVEKILGKKPREEYPAAFKVKTDQMISSIQSLSDKESLSLDFDLRTRILEYWKSNFRHIIDDLRRDDSTKAFYLRPDIMRPPFIFEILNKTALYVDKIVLVDPITYGQIVKVKGKTGFLRRFFAIHAPYLLFLRDWVEAGIVSLIPQPEFWNEQTKTKVQEFIKEDTRKMRNEIKPVGVLKPSGKMVPYPKGSKKEWAETETLTATKLATNINHTFFLSSSTGSIPTTDWSEDYHYWNWKLEQDQKAFGAEINILHALNKFPIQWFGNVPLDYILKLRQKGALSETRIVIRENFSEIQNAKENELEEVVNQCGENLGNQIRKHEREWDDVKSDFKDKVALKTVSAIATGLISASVSPQLSIPSIVGALIGGGIQLGRAIGDIAALRKEQRRLKRKSIHLLFDAKRQSGASAKHRRTRELKKSFGLIEFLEKDEPKYMVTIDFER